jgi:hypothetical protein
MIHGFLFFPGLVRAADAALDEACAWLRAAFAGRERGGRPPERAAAAATFIHLGPGVAGVT